MGRATADDAAGIAIVQAYSWLTTYAGLMPQEILDARVGRVREQAEFYGKVIGQGRDYWVAEYGGAVVGFAVSGASRDENFPQDGEIDALYLLKGFQGTGLGRKLFETCADALWKEGFARLIVNCLEGNPSLGFYEHMGGRAVGERSDTLRGHVICEKILRFELK